MISRRMLHVFSLTTLMVFMMPAFVKSFHELAHRNDSHCNEQSEQHYHAEQHHCSICDFVAFTDHDKLLIVFSKINIAFQNFNLFPDTTFLTSEFEYFLAGRAPPVFS